MNDKASKQWHIFITSSKPKTQSCITYVFIHSCLMNLLMDIHYVSISFKIFPMIIIGS